MSSVRASTFLWYFQELVDAVQAVLCGLLSEDAPHTLPPGLKTNTLTGTKWPEGYCEQAQLSFAVGPSDQALPSCEAVPDASE